MTQLSENFTLEQLTRSQTATRLKIENKPNDNEIEALKWLCIKILDPLVKLFETKKLGTLQLTSGFRSLSLNRSIGSKATSQHTKGQACDFVVNGMTVNQAYDLIKGTDLPYDQLINEFGQWLHISYDRNKTKQRREAFKL
jgi:zinc D-Ala-D-Ala carboxypeptidase